MAFAQGALPSFTHRDEDLAPIWHRVGRARIGDLGPPLSPHGDQPIWGACVCYIFKCGWVKRPGSQGRTGLVGPFQHFGHSEYQGMSKTKISPASERPIAKTVLAKLIQIGEPTRSIYAERLSELKSNARGALQLLSVWEGKRAELALTQPLSERERKNPKMLEARAAALARQAMDITVRPQKQKS